MIRFYIMPIMVVVVTPPVGDPSTRRGPSYLKWRRNPTGLAVRWSMKDYGSINVSVTAVDAEQADHDWLALQAGVYQFPEDLAVNVPQADVGALQSFLESYGIAGDWCSPSYTWRYTLRSITNMFLYMQRLTALTHNVSPLDWGVTLNTRLGALAAEQRAAIIEAFDSLGHDSSVLRSNWTLRIIIKTAADMFGETAILFGFVTL